MISKYANLLDGIQESVKHVQGEREGKLRWSIMITVYGASVDEAFSNGMIFPYYLLWNLDFCLSALKIVKREVWKSITRK